MIGDAGYELMVNLCSPKKPKDCDYDDVVKLMKDYLQPNPSFLAERYKFRQCRQADGQSIASFVAELKRLSRHCEFENTLDDNMRDQFVCGIKSDLIRQRLFAEEKVTYKKAISLACTLEAAERDSHVVENKNGTSSEINAIAYRSSLASGGGGVGVEREWNRGGAGGGNEIDRSVNKLESVNVNAPRAGCWSCGEPTHRQFECKYRSFICTNCNKTGHLRKVCPQSGGQRYQSSAPQRWRGNALRSGRGGRGGGGAGAGGAGRGARHSAHHWVRDAYDGVAYEDECEEYQQSGEEESLHLMSLGRYGPVCLPLLIEKKMTNMEIDTGSAISCISSSLYAEHFSHLTLLPCRITLKFYDGSKIKPLGYIEPQVSYKGVNKKLDLYVISNGSTNLLGRQWLAELGIKIPSFSVNKIVNGKMDKNSIVSNVISRHEELFDGSLGRFTGGQAALRVREGAAPVFCRAPPLPYALRERVDAELDAMLRTGVIEPVDHSDWATPLVIARKTDGGIRVCADYKVTLNQSLMVDQHPVPKIEDLFANLSGNVYFTKLDLSHAYNQYELDEASKMYTVINTHRGLFKYNGLVYGLASSPAIFQKMMLNLLKGIPNTINFLDDILIMSNDLDSHITTINEVFSRLKSQGLKLKKSKCVFLTSKVKFLGFIVDKDGVSVDPEKIKPILGMTPPTSTAELRSFLGMINFYGKFVRNLSSYLNPLYDLLRKGVTWIWNKKHQVAFEQIKRLLTSTEVLAHFDMARETVVTCDSSAYGIGVILAQRGPDGAERVVAYASRALTQPELHYSQIHKEALAIIFAVSKFHQYLYGRKFTLRTDHKPLVSIFGPGHGIPVTAASRLQRWAIILSAYDFVIEYVSTDRNTADALSRLIKAHKGDVEQEAGQIPEQTYLHFATEAFLLDYNKLKRETVSDPILSRVLSYIRDGWPTEVEIKELKPFLNRKNELYSELGCIMWGHRVVIPCHCREKVLNELHDSHMGMVKTKSLARSYVWWPGLDEAIEARCRACAVCAAVADAPPAHAPRPWCWPSRPWARLHLDFLGPIEGITYLVVVDSCSKWIEAIRMQRTSASAVIRVLRDLWARFGIPKQVVSDNGPPFTSVEFQSFLNHNGIEQILSAPYHPASNGAAESSVKICKRVIKKALKQKLDVDTALWRFLLTYRNTEHSTTGESPAQLLQGRALRTRLDGLKPERADRVRNAQDRQERAAGGVSRSMDTGESVWYRHYRAGDKWCPGQVVERLGTTDYNVRSSNGTEVHRHIDQLRGRTLDPGNVQSKPQIIRNRQARNSLLFPGSGEEGSPRAGGPRDSVEASGGSAGATPATPPATTPVRSDDQLLSPALPPVRKSRPVRQRRPVIRFGFDPE